MVLPRKLRKNIKKFISPISKFKIVKFNPLPLTAENMKNGEKLKTYFIKAYCRSCKEDTMHSISPSGELITIGPIILVRCTNCGYPKFYTNTIHKFIYKYCKRCERNTIHALNSIYLDPPKYEIRITCLGCGTHVSVGSDTRESIGSSYENHEPTDRDLS